MKEKQKYARFGKLAAENALRFAFNVLFAFAFQILFGAENILPAVAVCVGLTTLPYMDLGIRPLPMAGMILFLYMGTGFAAQFALASPWLALPVNFIFVLLILLFCSEPVEKRGSISFLLCFVFCQANPVTPAAFPMRMAALTFGGLLVAAVTGLWWKHKGIGRDGRTLEKQIQLCAENKGYIFRMAAGLSAAMLIGMAAGFKRPMWISIVVMSLTQLDFAETRRRMLYRSLATILGAVVFMGVLVPFIPKQYAVLFILLIGYLSFFTKEYKYTQIVNAINALNAALVVLQPVGAAVGRVFCLGIGIGVTMAMWGLEYCVRQLSGVRFRKTAEA